MVIYSLDISELWLAELYINYLMGEYGAFPAAEAIQTITNFRSTWYPLLLGEQKRCGFKVSQGFNT